jgi:putative N6-adenine-specific DNA methylase
LDAVDLAKSNVKKALLEEFITVQKCDFKDFIPPTDGGLVMMNPPYGERLKEDEINLFYKGIGDTLKKNYHRL